jgi:hypothetical protein
MSNDAAPTFIDVALGACAVAEDGLTLRFKCAGPARRVTEVAYESEDGEGGRWRVVAVDADEAIAAQDVTAVPVEDSSDGTVWLIVGGSGGLRLEHVETGTVAREPYLVLAITTTLA